MKKAILHIGMHKTGSSSIQATLDGFDNGQIRFADLGRRNHSKALFTIFSDKRYNFRVYRKQGRDEDYVDQIAADYAAKLDAELARPTETIILSAETVSRFNRKNLERLRDRVVASGRDIEVVCYVRDPFGFAGSMMQQVIKSGKANPPLPWPHYRKYFGPYLDLFAPESLTFRKFDPAAFPDGSVTKDFLGLLGLDEATLPEKKTNVGGSFGAIQLMHLFHTTMPVFFGTPELHAAQRRLRGMIINNVKGAKFRLPSGYPQVTAEMRDDVEWAAENLGIDFGPQLDAKAREPVAQSLDAALADIDDDTIAALDQILRKRGVKAKSSQDSAEKMALLFYDFLIKAAKDNGRLGGKYMQGKRWLGSMLPALRRRFGRPA